MVEVNFDSLLAEKISRFVRAHWADTKSALPLSSVGTKLAAEHLSTKTLFPNGGFLSFVKEKQAAFGYQIFQNPDRPEQIWLFPAGEIQEPKLSDFAEPVRPKPRSYPSSLWSAFIDKAVEGKRRFVSNPPGDSYFDLPLTESPSEDLLEIPQQYLNISGGFVPPQTVHDRIPLWMQEVGIDIASDNSPTEASTARLATNSLETFLADLSDDQRKSLVFRGDIVFQFLRK